MRGNLVELIVVKRLARGNLVGPIVRNLPRGMLTAAATEGLEGSDEKGNVEVGDRASSSITKYYAPGPIAFRRRRFDSKPL